MTQLNRRQLNHYYRAHARWPARLIGRRPSRRSAAGPAPAATRVALVARPDGAIQVRYLSGAKRAAARRLIGVQSAAVNRAQAGPEVAARRATLLQAAGGRRPARACIRARGRPSASCEPLGALARRPCRAHAQGSRHLDLKVAPGSVQTRCKPKGSSQMTCAGPPSIDSARRSRPLASGKALGQR